MTDTTSPGVGVNGILLAHQSQVEQAIVEGLKKLGIKTDGKFIPFLTPKQLAQLLNLSEKTLERMRKDGSGPPFTKIGNKRIRYSIPKLETWLKERTFQ